MSKDQLAERFGENLKAYRKKSGLSQEELANSAEVHRTQVSQLERAKHLPRLDTFVKLVGALGLSPEDLLEGLAFKPGIRQRGTFKISEPPSEE